MSERDADLRARIAAALGEAAITALRAVGGGDINEAYAATTSGGRTIFVKHEARAPRGLFAAEADGLAWLAEPRALRVPAVLAIADDFLALEFLDGRRGADHDEALGRGLAALHAAGAPGWGHARDNFIATIPQDNRGAPSWLDFWIDRRVAPLIARALELGRAPARWRGAADALRASLPGTIPDEPPARLHGDLWSGNVHAHAGAPALIDPAVYGGHREVDLAMLALFGGLGERVARAYDEARPLADGWRARLPLWQLQPLLVHTVLFGGGYAAQADAVLRRYGA